MLRNQLVKLPVLSTGHDLPAVAAAITHVLLQARLRVLFVLLGLFLLIQVRPVLNIT